MTLQQGVGSAVASLGQSVQAVMRIAALRRFGLVGGAQSEQIAGRIELVTRAQAVGADRFHEHLLVVSVVAIGDRLQFAERGFAKFLLDRLS